MAENPFKKLAQTLRAKQTTVEIDVSDHLSNVLDEHLDLIAAAHHSVHGSNHHSHPSLEEVVS